MSDEKTEQPTLKKLQDARKDGQVSRSTDLSDAVSMSAVIALLAFMAERFGAGMRAIVNVALDFVNADHSAVSMQIHLYRLGALAATVVLPAACVAALASVATSVAQVGVQISTKPVTPNLETVNPMAGFKRIFSARTLIDCAKMGVKAGVVICVMWLTIRKLFPLVVGSLYEPLPELVQIVWRLLLELFTVAAVVFTLIGAADVLIQQMLYRKSLMMSKDEIKRERKDQDGDPLIKSERRRIARAAVTGPPPAKIGLANMLLVNPTHYSVAVRYAPEECPLPYILAKGMDEQAAELRQAARAAGVPIIGHPPMARALYRIDLDEPIPEELFEAVAAILRWLEPLRSLSPRDQPASGAGLAGTSPLN